MHTEQIKYLENIGILDWELIPSYYYYSKNGIISYEEYVLGWSRKLLRYKIK